MRCILGHSDEVSSEDAVADLVAQCQHQLQGEQPVAGILFASNDYSHEVILEGIAEAWPGLPLVGGSSDGEISTSLGFCHDSVLLTLLVGEGVTARVGVGRSISQSIESAVDEAMAEANVEDPKLCISVLAPSSNGSEVVRALNRRLGQGCPILGGLSGDHRESFSKMKEFSGREVLTDSLPLLFLSGDLECSWGVGSGWFPRGEQHVVTRSDGHMVYEIDGKPAIDAYQGHYGAIPGGSLGEYPLAVYGDPEDSERWTLRAILDSNAEEGSLRFAGEVLEGSSVRFTEVLPEGILAGSTTSLASALENYPGDSPELAMVFSCAARKWVLGTQAQQEIDRLIACADSKDFSGLQIAGLYCFGEISPYSDGLLSTFHNETCVSLVLGR